MLRAGGLPLAQHARDELLQRHLGRAARRSGRRSASRNYARSARRSAVARRARQHAPLRPRRRRRRRWCWASSLALLLQPRRAAAASFYRTVFILPILVPGIVIGAIWKLMYNFDFGLINQAVGLVGLGPRDWLGDNETALAVGDRRRHLALDAVLLPAAARRPRIPAAGRLRGGQDRRRVAAGRSCVHITLPLMCAGDPRHASPSGWSSPSRSSTRSTC